MRPRSLKSESRLSNYKKTKNMKTFGVILVVIGLVWAVIAFNMSTTVEVGGERIGSGVYSIEVPRGQVNNFGLMEQRRNQLMMAGVTIIAGVILFGFGAQSEERVVVPAEESRTCPHCAELVKREAKVCRYCQRNLPAFEIEVVSELEAETLVEAQQPKKELETEIPPNEKARCPNCQEIIRLSARECPICRADFSYVAAWKPVPVP